MDKWKIVLEPVSYLEKCRLAGDFVFRVKGRLAAVALWKRLRAQSSGEDKSSQESFVDFKET